MSYRLKAVDAQHPDIVALKYGPLVLFPISSSVPEVTRQELLGARRAEGRSWQVQTKMGSLKLLPFTEITDQTYTTYVRVS